jgi:diguanylate cyclase (GGDEF)-like protein
MGTVSQRWNLLVPTGEGMRRARSIGHPPNNEGGMGSPVEDAPAFKPSRALTLGRLLNRSRKIQQAIAIAVADLKASNHAFHAVASRGTIDQATREAIARSCDAEDKAAEAARELGAVIDEIASEVTGRAELTVELTELRSEAKVLRYHLAMLKAREDAFRRIALHDPLTGLANRILFEESLEQGMAVARRHGWGLAVLFIDVDRFKSINDRYGHAVGDAVLRHVAECLKAFVREGDTVCRWAGDEFTCLLLEVTSEGDAKRVAEQMIAQLAEECHLGHVTLSIGASIGIAMFPEDGDVADLLICSADRAMYCAKQTGRSVVVHRECADEPEVQRLN